MPLALAKRTHQLATAHAKGLDRELLDALERKGFRLDFGEDGTGWQFKYLTRGGGYYFNVGCSDLIVEGKIRLAQYNELKAVLPGADLVVLATGWEGPEALVAKLFGEAVAARVGPIWGFGDDQELRNMFRRTPQPGLWFIAGSFAQCRIYSRYLALQIQKDLIDYRDRTASIDTTRSTRRSECCRSDSERITVMPASLRPRTTSARRCASAGATPSNGSSSKQQAGAAHQRARERGQLLLAAGELRALARAELADLGGMPRISRRARGRRRRRRPTPAEQDVLLHRELGDQPAVLGHVADAQRARARA